MLFGVYRRAVLALLREVNALAAAGVLVRKRVGNQVHFQANPDCPVFEDLRNILKKTVGMADVLREALAPAQALLRREVNPNVYPALEFGKKAAAGDPFLKRVLADRKIFIIGGEDDLGKPVANRKAEGARRRRYGNPPAARAAVFARRLTIFPNWEHRGNLPHNVDPGCD